MKKMKKGLSVALAFSMIVTGAMYQNEMADAAKKATIKTKKITIRVGEKKKIQIKAKKAKAKYTFSSSKKKVASVNKKGMVTGKKKGTAKITVKEKSGKKVRSLGKVTVVVKAKKVVGPQITEAPAQTSAPVATQTPVATTSAPTTTPVVTPIPTVEPTPVPTLEPWLQYPIDSGYHPTEEQYKTMIADSLISTGNNAKVKAVIEKARAGEDVTLAYIGGSVTEGEGATPNDNCYAEFSCTEFGKEFGTGDNVHFVNGGMSGTPSSLGIIRYEKDILGQMTTASTTPDILFIEFAVNDHGECTSGGAYEGLIRRAMSQGAAVVLLFSVFRNNDNIQTTYIPYGEHYDLPMISMKNAVATTIDEDDDFRDWYFADMYHPNNGGYRLTSDCIMNYFKTVDAEAVEIDNVPDVSAFAAYNTDAYVGTTAMTPATINNLLAQENALVTSFDAGGFSATDANTGVYLYDNTREKFPENWMHTADTSSDYFQTTIHCKNLMVVYKRSSDVNTGNAELYVDGERVKTLTAYDRSGWNQAITDFAFSNEEVAEHTIEIKMVEGDEAKEFTILALGYN